jgi:polar amino acid transport system permease protein
VNYTFDFGRVLDGLPDLLWGCGGTLQLALSGMVLALVIGIGGVVLRDSRVSAPRWLVISFVEAIRNTPFLGQIYFIFFALPSISTAGNPGGKAPDAMKCFGPSRRSSVSK